MAGFSNPILGALGRLIREKLQSVNFLTGVDGWMLAQNGDAELNDVSIRGQFVVAGPNGTFIRGYVVSTVINGIPMTIPVLDFGAADPVTPGWSVSPGSIFEYTDTGYEYLGIDSPTQFQPGATGMSQILLRSGKLADPLSAILLNADDIGVFGVLSNGNSLMDYPYATSGDSAFSVAVGLNSATLAVVFPTAFPVGVVPKVYTSVVTNSGASALWMARPFGTPTNTGFTIRVGSTNAAAVAGSALALTVQWHAFLPV